MSFEIACYAFDARFVRTFCRLLTQDAPSSNIDRRLEILNAVRAYRHAMYSLLRLPSFSADTHGNIGLIDVFAADARLFAARPRNASEIDGGSSNFVLPLPAKDRLQAGERCIVGSIAEFKRNWDAFSVGNLRGLTDWSNIIVAGGSPHICLSPVPKDRARTNADLVTYYYQSTFFNSDIDIFIYGDQSDLFVKVVERVRRALLLNRNQYFSMCYNTSTVTFSDSPLTRKIQIINRVYPSPAHIVSQFDLDVTCCVYNGTNVYMTPRSIAAFVHQSITADGPPTSLRYEIRLLKYSLRRFEIWIPQLDRSKIDNQIFKRTFSQSSGLPLLLFSEKMINKRRTTQSRVGTIRTITHIYEFILHKEWLQLRELRQEKEQEINPSSADTTDWDRVAYDEIKSRLPTTVEGWLQSAYIQTDISD